MNHMGRPNNKKAIFLTLYSSEIMKMIPLPVLGSNMNGMHNYNKLISYTKQILKMKGNFMIPLSATGQGLW